MNRFDRNHCQVCGAELNPQQAVTGELCDDLSCRGPHLQELRRIEDQKRQAWREQKADEALSLAEMTREESGPFSVVPRNDRRLSDTPNERLEEFQRTLRDVISSVAKSREQSHGTLSTQDTQQNQLPPSLYVVNACTTCGGACCRNGSTHAFLDAASVERIWNAHPEFTSEQLFALFIEQLPKQSFRGSCVFHDAEGCRLRRETRGDVCNSFLCEGIHDHLEDFDRENTRISVSVSLDDIGTVRRVAQIDRDGIRTVRYANDST